jgi:hypothetical protein
MNTDVTRVLRRAVWPLLLLQAWYTPAAFAQPDGGDVRFAIMGNRGLDGTIRGETVEVFVPWDGVNSSETTVSCLVGAFHLKSDGAEDRAKIGLDGAVVLRLHLDSSNDGTWEVVEANGRCSSLGGSGIFRRTLWADGAVSYRFIGEASLKVAEDAS